MKKLYHLGNPNLQKLDLPFVWKGNPLNNKRRFENHEHLFSTTWGDVVKWRRDERPFKKEKQSDGWKLPVSSDFSWLKTEDDCVAWLGHATFFIRLKGKSFLIDPILGGVGPLKRRCPFPIDPEEFPHLDAILISHDHRDHLDAKSVRKLGKLNPEARWLTGLNLGRRVGRMSRSKKVEEAGWYQTYTPFDDVKVHYLPTRHWSRRFLSDTNKSLWGAFVFESEDFKIYFGSDSGYGSHYKDAAKVFGKFDVAMLGIGAYEPRWFMAPSHTSPEDAWQAFEDLNADVLIPMHYGVFDLSDEPFSQPEQLIRKCAEKTPEKLRVLQAGEAHFLR